MKYKKKVARLKARQQHWLKFPESPEGHARRKPGSVNGK